MDWSVVLHPSCSHETLTLATELGFTILTDIDDNVSKKQPSESATYLIMPHSDAPLDGQVIKALMTEMPVVSAEWLLKWKERKVWKNKHPNHEDYSVNFVNSARLSPESVLEKARDAVQRQPLKKLKFFFKPEEKEESVDDRIYLGLQSATVLAGGKLANWPTTKAKVPKRDKKSCVLVLPSQQQHHHVPAYLKKFKWITYDSLTLGIITDLVDQYIIDPEHDDGNVPYPVGTVPDSEDETEAMEMDVAAQVAVEEEKEVEDEAVSQEDPVKARKAAKPKKSPQKSPSRTTTRSKRKMDTSEIDLVSEGEQQEEEKSREKGRQKAPAAANDSATASKRQRTRGGKKASIAASQDDSIALKSMPSVRHSPIKKGRKGTTAPPPPVDAPVPDSALKPQAPSAAKSNSKNTAAKSKASKASASPFSGKGASKKAGGYASIVLPPGGGWKSVALKKQKDREEGSTNAKTTTAQPSVPRDAAPASTSNAAPPVEDIINESIVIVDTSLVVAPFTDFHDEDGNGAPGGHEGGFKAFRRKCSTSGYGIGGTARLPRVPFDPEPYREGEGYKTKANDEFLREEAEKEAAMEAANALFDANLRPKRDKKALDEGKKKLLGLAMLPEASRRRLEK